MFMWPVAFQSGVHGSKGLLAAHLEQDNFHHVHLEFNRAERPSQPAQATEVDEVCCENLVIFYECLSHDSRVYLAGKGRHSDPEVGPVLHDAIHHLLNDELKLATTFPSGRRRPAAAARAPSPAAAGGSCTEVAAELTADSSSGSEPSEPSYVDSKSAQSSRGIHSGEQRVAGGPGVERNRGAGRGGGAGRGRAGELADAGSLVIRRDILAEWLASRKGLLKSNLLRS